MYIFHRGNWVVRLFILVILIGSTYPVNASPSIRKNSSDSTDWSSPPGLIVDTLSSGNIILELNLPHYQVKQRSTENGSCQAMILEGYSRENVFGMPELPFTRILVGIPLESTPSIKILEEEIVTLGGKYDICPGITPISNNHSLSDSTNILNNYLFENKILSSPTKEYLVQPIYLVSTGMIRSQRIANLQLNPFLYNPDTEELRAVSHLKVLINFDVGNQAEEIVTEYNEGPFEPLLRLTLANYDQARAWRSVTRLNITTSKPLGTTTIQNSPVYKIAVDQDGVYQVTYTQLLDAGVSADILTSLNPKTIRIVNQGTEIPIYVTGQEDDQFNPSDAIQFFGQAVNTKYTTTNIYWLTWGDGDGLRMPTLDGTLDNVIPTQTQSITTLHLEENHTYYVNSPSGPQLDHWYWSVLNASSSPATQNFYFTITNISPDTSFVKIRGLLKGFSATPQHHTRIFLNGHLLEEQTWPSTDEYLFSVEVSTAFLTEGSNTITIECPRDGFVTSDIVLVNWFEIEYTQTQYADNGLLKFDSQIPQQPTEVIFGVRGFNGSEIDILDITDPKSPKRIVGGNIINDNTSYQLSFQQSITGLRHFLAFEPSRRLTPLSITLDTLSDLKNSANRADYLIIAPKDFLHAIQPLANLRANQGYRVQLIDVQDIYDEFSAGVFNPQAIHDFLAYTYTRWVASPPSYVLLVGDGHYDFKNYLGNSGPNFIPPYLGEFDPWIGETSADNRYVTVSGNDPFPDMYIGRLPANSSTEVTAMVDKIISYEQTPILADWNKKVTFIADNPDSGGDFPSYSDNIADHYFTSDFSIEKIYYPSTQPTVSLAQEAILTAINQGRLIINFTGHAAINQWASENLFSVSRIPDLTNSGKYPFFVSMTCQEGYFIRPNSIGSIGENIVRAHDKGAIASFSPTGFGLAAGHDILSQGLYTAIFSDGITQLGPATTYAKLYLDSHSSGFNDLIDTYMLFGDPATRLQVPQYQNTYLPVISQ